MPLVVVVVVVVAAVVASLLAAEVLLYVHRNRRFIRDGSPGRPPPLPFTQLLSSVVACSVARETAVAVLK